MVLRDASQFDVIHFHCDYVHFPALRRQHVSTVTTMHGSIRAHDVGALLREYADVPLISISDDQRRPVPDAAWQRSVYHGLPRTLFQYRERPDDYLAFLGRMSPEKASDSRDRDRAPMWLSAENGREDQPQSMAVLPEVLVVLLNSLTDVAQTIRGDDETELL